VIGSIVVSMKTLIMSVGFIERRLMIIAVEINVTPMLTRLYSIAARMMNDMASAVSGSSKTKLAVLLSSIEHHQLFGCALSLSLFFLRSG
jgi:hypothetical protein